MAPSVPHQHFIDLYKPGRQTSCVLRMLIRFCEAMGPSICIVSQRLTLPGLQIVPVCRGDIQFYEVMLRYSRQGAWALDGISFRVAAGTSLALVGRTGAKPHSHVLWMPPSSHPPGGTL